MPIKEESQQPNAGRQHPIPQNVMDVEFKVVGDLTVRQLMYLFAGGTFAYLIYRSELPAFWRIIITFISVVGTVAIAFVPYQERGLDKWFMSFLKAMTMPTQMVWRKTYSPPAYFLSDYANIIKNEIITLTPAKSRNKLDDYLGHLSESENELDKLEAMRLQGIRMGFSNQANNSILMQQTTTQSYSPSLGTTTTTETEVIYSDDNISPGRSISDADKVQNEPIQRQPLPEITPEPAEPKRGPDQSFTPSPPQIKTPEQSKPQPIQTAAIEPKKADISTQPKPINNQNINIQQQFNSTQQNQSRLQAQQKPQQKPISEERKALMKDIMENEISSKKELLNSIEFKKPTLSSTSIDRAIINIPSNPRGEIKIKTTTRLPKTIVVQDIKDIENKESSLEKKVGELLEVTKHVRAEMQNAQDKEAHMNKNQSRVEFFANKYQELEKERAKITTQLDESTSHVQQISSPDATDLSEQVAALARKNEELKAQLAEIQSGISVLRNPPTNDTAQVQAQAQAQSQPQPQPQAEIQQKPQIVVHREEHLLQDTKPEAAQQKPEKTPEPPKPQTEAPQKPQPNPIQQNNLNNYVDPNQSLNTVSNQETTPQGSQSPAQNSNLITGIVKNKSGELIDTAVVIIKDKDGDAIRALKTNQLGQFKTQTPMQNGKYTVEVIKGGMKFDIISVEAKGDVISPLYIVAYE